MKIELEKPAPKKIRDISWGQCFSYGGKVYMRTNGLVYKNNVIKLNVAFPENFLGVLVASLDTGELVGFCIETEVTPLDAKVTCTEKKNSEKG